MTGVRIEIVGAEAAIAALAAAAGALTNARPLYDHIGAAMVAATQQRFLDEAGPDGSPWPMSLRAAMEGGKTLTDTAFLRNSQTHEASDTGVAFGTNAIYGAIHQLGGVIRAKTPKGLRFRSGRNGGWTTKQEVTIPARPFLGVDAEDEKIIERLAGDAIGAEHAG